MNCGPRGRRAGVADLRYRQFGGISISPILERFSTVMNRRGIPTERDF
jgi:hypothetical protein